MNKKPNSVQTELFTEFAAGQSAAPAAPKQNAGSPPAGKVQPRQPKKATPPPAPSAELAADQAAKTVRSLQATLAKTADPAARMKVCEDALGEHRVALAEGSTRVLVAAVILAISCNPELYESYKDENGKPRFTKVTAFLAYLLQALKVGYSPGRISRLRKGGDFYLQLLDQGLFTPCALEVITMIRRLKDGALAGWRHLCKVHGRAPTLTEVEAYVAKKRKTGQVPKVKENRWERVHTLALQGSQALERGVDAAELATIFDQIKALAVISQRLSSQTKGKDRADRKNA